jgi:hypothetical protein
MISQDSYIVYSCGLSSRVSETCLICFPSHLSFVTCFVFSRLLLAGILNFPLQDMSGLMGLLFASPPCHCSGCSIIFSTTTGGDWHCIPAVFLLLLCFCLHSAPPFVYHLICMWPFYPMSCGMLFGILDCSVCGYKTIVSYYYQSWWYEAMSLAAFIQVQYSHLLQFINLISFQFDIYLWRLS